MGSDATVTAPVDLGLGHIRIGSRSTEAPVGAGSHYGPAGGILELRRALAAWEGVGEESVCITTGASLGLVATLATIDRPGTVLCPRPYYPAYPKVAGMLGLGVAYYELDPATGWLPDLNRLASMLDHTTRAIIWNFPHNPTGACVASGHLLRHVREMVAGRDIVVICDEVYGDFQYAARPVDEPDGSRELGSLVRLRSFSKGFGLPGERLGYAIASPGRVQAIRSAHWTLAMSPPATAQLAALSVIRAGPQERLARLRATLLRHRTLVADLLDRCPGVTFSVPAGGVFYWIEVPGSPVTSERLAEICLHRGVVVVPGSAFGVRSPVYVRVSFAVPEADLRLGVDRLVEVLAAAVRVENAGTVSVRRAPSEARR